MKLQPSETMTVDTLAAEIRRQADYHAAQGYPFPTLTIRRTRSSDREGEVLVDYPGSPLTVWIDLTGGIAEISLQPTTPGIHSRQPIAECTAEWSAAMHALEPFMPGEAAAEPIITV